MLCCNACRVLSEVDVLQPLSRLYGALSDGPLGNRLDPMLLTGCMHMNS